MSDSISPQDLPDATEPAPAPAPPHILKLPVELLLIVFASVSGLPDAVSLACSSRYLASVFDTNRYYIQLQLLHTHRNFTNPLTGFSFYDLTCKLLKVRQLICCQQLDSKRKIKLLIDLKNLVHHTALLIKDRLTYTNAPADPEGYISLYIVDVISEIVHRIYKLLDPDREEKDLPAIPGSRELLKSLCEVHPNVFIVHNMILMMWMEDGTEEDPWEIVELIVRADRESGRRDLLLLIRYLDQDLQRALYEECIRRGEHVKLLRWLVEWQHYDGDE